MCCVVWGVFFDWHSLHCQLSSRTGSSSKPGTSSNSSVLHMRTVNVMYVPPGKNDDSSLSCEAILLICSTETLPAALQSSSVPKGTVAVNTTAPGMTAPSLAACMIGITTVEGHKSLRTAGKRCWCLGRRTILTCNGTFSGLFRLLIG